MRYIVGVDPGLSGGIALYDIEANTVRLHYMPTFDKRVDVQTVATILVGFQPDMVAIEDVHAMPKQGVSSTFTFGRSLGAIEGVVGALSLPHVRMRPQEWKKEMGLLRKDKDASRALASELWPSVAHELRTKKSDGLAEAALIAEATRRKNRDRNTGS